MAIQILTLIIAILAVIFGPLISYKIAKKNLEFNYRTIIKARWLNELRNNVHLFLDSVLEWFEKYPGIKEGILPREQANKEIDRMLDKINSSFIQLQLQLDINDTLQKEIIDNIVKIKEIINCKKYDQATINDLRKRHEDIVEKFKVMFNKERMKIRKIFK